MEQFKDIAIVISILTLPFVMFILHNINNSISKIAEELTSLRVSLPKEYVTKEDCKRLHEDFQARFEKIY